MMCRILPVIGALLLLTGCGNDCDILPVIDAGSAEAVTAEIAEMLSETRQICCLRLPETLHPDYAACIREAQHGYAGTLLKTVTWQRRGELLTVSAVYADAPETVRTMKQELQNAVMQQAAELSGFSQPEQVLLLHDLLIRRCDYCADAPFSDSAYGVLKGKAVCGGYAEFFALAAEACGIPAMTVTGTCIQNGEEQPHAWNLVQLGGAWYHVDCTRDEGDPPSHAYFLRTDKQMLHDFIWARQDYPSADGTACRYDLIMQHLFSMDQMTAEAWRVT